MVTDARTTTVTGDQAAVERLWYIPQPPEASRGWLVYSTDFILAALQGRAAEPHTVSHSAPWVLVAAIVRCLMALGQIILIILAWLPITSSLLETVARVFSRNAVGFFLRACYWKAKLRYLGQDTFIDQNVEIWGPKAVSIGSHCHIDTNARLAAGERRQAQHGWIRIGDYVHVGPGVHIAGRGGVEIGDMVGISANAHFYSASNTIELPSDPGQLISMSHIAPHDQQHIIEAPVIIEEYAFIGMMARIMPGVRVGRAAIIHANTELRRSVPAFANIGGVHQGRQIGWRKPRRPSPRLALAGVRELRKRAAEEIVATGVRVREILDPNDWRTIESVTDLHYGAFQEGVTTHLGRAFVHRYYRAMISNPDASLWAAELDGRVVGFLGCTLDRHGFERANRSGKTRLLAAWRFCTFRLSPFAVIRAFRKQRLSRGLEDEAELLSIVVAPSGRRHGLGKAFLDIFFEKLRSVPLLSFIVFTDNPEGYAFYTKYGGECLFQFRLRSLQSACFRFTISPEGPADQGDGQRAEDGASESLGDGAHTVAAPPAE
ncbi:MAG: GNAT family N-acetyltransferase [Phycisphaerae bacterium]|nr:GNAT family N-acetyltransferase [Phycisphaerae bacterium]